jgi:cyclic-di-AMP phosphodiesterase PgpH
LPAGSSPESSPPASHPLMEMAFGYTTKSSLLELANLDQPILRRLMLEAPGTYHHSVIVGSMAEAAASEIGANPLIAKVSGYYHDIGKLKNPLYFIENQRDGKNIHNKLAPSMSCLILTSHVKNGVEIAREKKLGQQITDAITQHHGTTLISFFYEKAKKLQKDQVVNIDDFRYPGPKPQTRETALVMLADVVEAAARTLEQPTPSRIQGLVQQLINKLFSDHQLDECPLTLKDLNNIAKSFNKILSGIYHHRIEYPDVQPPG